VGDTITNGPSEGQLQRAKENELLLAEMGLSLLSRDLPYDGDESYVVANREGKKFMVSARSDKFDGGWLRIERVET